MRIAFNPSTVEALITPPNNKDITFDLRGRNIFARGVKFCGTDTNTWRDIKINNVSIGSHTLDLRNGSNTTLTNTNGVVTINSTWRPVVDNLTSDSTTSSLSAKQGKVLKSLIDGKSNSGHNHDNKYLKWLGNAGQPNMNAIGRISHSSGMTYLADPGNTTDNPMEGSSKSTSWHLYWQTNYTDDPSGSSAWVAQIVNKAGTDRWWVRSRSGGTITNGTNWTSNWRFLVTAPTSGLGNRNQPVYINSAGEVVAANSYPTTLPANGGNADTVDGEHASNFSYTHQTSFDFSKGKSGRIVTFDQSDTDYGWINGFASTHGNYLTSVLFNAHRTSNWYVGYIEGNTSTGKTNGLQAVHKLAFVDQIPTSLKNPHSLTLKANGTTLATYDGSSAKEVNFTYTNIGAASASHNHDNRYVRKWTGVYGSANKFLKLAIGIEKGWIRLEVSDSNDILTAGYGIYIIGWGWHDSNSTDTLFARCLYANDSRYTTALKIVRTSRNNYDFYFQFASSASYPSYTINYSSTVSSIDCTVTAINTIPTATWTSSLSALQLNASQVDWSGITNKPSAFNPAAHTHTVFNNNLMIKGTNGISNSASIHLGIGDSDTGFKWISDGKCQIYANNVAVGEWTSGGMNWFKNPTVNGNKVWNAGNDGSGSGLDADTVDGYHATDGRTFTGNINWSNNWNDAWSDGTNRHPWYGFDHRYPNTGAYSTTITDYFGMTIKTANTLRLDFGTLLLNGTSIYSINVASATKLQTPRSIWGQSFNGTADVNGTIYINNSDSSNGAIRLNNNVNSNARISAISGQVIFNTSSAIRFGETDWDWNQWAGLKYTHSNKTIYLGIADNSIFNANSAQSGGTLNLRAGISNIDLNSGTSIRGLPTDGSPYNSSITLRDTSISLSAYGSISMSTGPGAIELNSQYTGVKLSCGQGASASISSDVKISSSQGVYLNQGNSGNVSLCQGGGKVGIGVVTPSYTLDVNGYMRASGFHHSSVNSDNYMLLAGGGYKSFGGDSSHPIFLGYLNLDHGNDGTVSSSFYCLGYSVSFTYTRGGNYCKISIPDTSHQTFYIRAAIASVNYSGGGMDTWTGYHRGTGAWWLHCYASGMNEVRVKGFRQSNDSNDSWWGGNPLWSGNDGANRITVCIFGYVTFK